MTEREQLEQAIAHLETQRAVMGDAADAAIAALRQKLDALQPTKRSAALHGERKLVTIMFADISGFTTMSEKMDPEAVRALMNACFERLVPVIKKYDGTIDKFIGDEIMALFGAPLAHENDPERALRAAVEMFDTLETFNAEHGVSLGIHFGINTGLVIAGGIGAQEQQEYSVMGDAVNLAKRLEDVSERGEILVGADTFRAIAPLFDFDALTPLEVKGKIEPVQVYRLLGAKAKPGSVRGLESHGLHSALVGRDKELLTLLSAVEQLDSGHGGLVFLIGEAGMGKSRLMAEVRQQSAGKRVLWLEGHALSLEQTIGYWLFQEIVRQWAGITDRDSEATAWTKLELCVTELSPEHVAEFLPYLASLLTLKVREEFADRVKYLDGEAMGRQIFFTMRRFFEHLAQTRPLVLVFEDLHWADASSANLLEHLLPLVAQAPLLICIISRPEQTRRMKPLQEVAAREYASRTTTIRLAPLAPTESTQLVCNLLELQSLPVSLRDTILHKAEGNPFFVEEVIRTLIDAGAIVREPDKGGLLVTDQAEHVTIPDNIQGLVMARVDRLADEVKQVLGVASVIGRSFLYRVLRALWEADKELDQHLAKLRQIELIREKRQVPELEYIFKHALVHEATYTSLLLQRRRELHMQVGNCIETLFADWLEEFYGVLAHHYTQAENWEKAQAYLFKAADQAGSIAADAEALQHYQQALAAYERVFGDRWEPLQRASLERKMGEALFRRGSHQQAIASLHKSAEILGQPFPTTNLGVRWAIAKQLGRQVVHRVLPGVFVKTTRQISPTTEELVRVYEFMAWVDYCISPEHWLLDTIQILNISEQNGFASGMARGYAAVGIGLDVIGFVRLAGYYHKKAVTIAEKEQDLRGLGITYLGLGLHRWYLGLLDDLTISHYRKSADSFWAAGDLSEWSVATAGGHLIYLHRSDFANSLRVCYDFAQVGETGRDMHAIAIGMYGLGRTWHRMGLLDKAANELQQAIELYKEIPDYGGQVEVGGELGLCYLHQGNIERALAVLDQAYKILQAKNLVGHQSIPCLIGLTEAYLATARAETSHRDKWLNKAAHMCQAALKQSRNCRPWLPHALRLQGRYEWLKGESRNAHKHWQESLKVAREMGTRYELGMTHLEIGQHLQDHAHLEQAEDILAQLGTKWDWVQAQTLE